MRKLKNITPLEEDFSQWFTDVVKQGDLIEYGPAKGSIIFKPISYGIWENIQKELNAIFKKNHIQNVYLPLLIPKSYLNREADHIKGFAPELATITKVGDKELSEHYVIRPTSEMLFGELFQKEINSHNDLPKLYNQWANVIRWEKTTRPFLRTSEFLWQEGHTVHTSSAEARKITRKMIKLYAKFLEKYLAIPVLIGKKTHKEKFAGAVTTYTIEAMMKDGKALQSGTSHYLGQNFAKAMNIKFQTKDNKQEYGFQTSWGVSTRLIGALIMAHGDNRGIIIPPMIAPTQIDIIEVFGHKNPDVREMAMKLEKILGRKLRVRREASSKGPGFKAGQSEIQGTPLRIEVGPRDLQENKVTFVRRDTLEKYQVNIENIKTKTDELLKAIQANLLHVAKDRLKTNTVMADTYEELKKLIQKGKFVVAPFAGGDKEEDLIKLETLASTRCIPFSYKLKELKGCIITMKKTRRLVVFAKAY
ncbi:proline--tRNA ligase [Candidatus Mycoplasma mahonii]|uniref:proline--tRNA ligase n=1 Tax=Candidatus Mycoplasma mahonii TaxID=3004105 RepID=UPI0026F2D53C|nr:proline--tRNA ligase [Candidatus Mycoplasma mahonii]WKX02477.1 proline--tRNA ligase [Candidatus Mycoplasma mahonii]